MVFEMVFSVPVIAQFQSIGREWVGGRGMRWELVVSGEPKTG